VGEQIFHYATFDLYAEYRGSYCVRTLSGHAEWVREVVPSEDGRWLISSSSDQVCATNSDMST
jgi:WD40 repeat protein